MYLNETKSFDLEYSVQQLKKVDPALTEMFNQVQVNPLEPEKNYFSIIDTLYYLPTVERECCEKNIQ